MVEIPDKSFLQLCIELLKHESFHNNEREKEKKKEGGGGGGPHSQIMGTC